MGDPRTASTGIAGLDEILDGLRLGDNVVWRVEDLDDYRAFLQPFVETAQAQGRAIIYLRYGQHAPLLEPGPGVRLVEIDARGGFEAVTSRVYQLITDYGRGAFYVCDCLSDLLQAWTTDYMVGNFFRVVCPYLFELDTVAYFALHPRSHSHETLARIRETTQVLIDVRRAGDEMHVQPVKVWQRYSPTMFLPHRRRGERFTPVTDSSDATRLQDWLERQHPDNGQLRLLDYWDRLFLSAEEQLHQPTDDPQRRAVLEELLAALIGHDPRLLELARTYLDLDDLLGVRARMIGSGYIGGKAVGMLLARNILLTEDGPRWLGALEPHDSFYLGSDAYYAYLVHNGWWPRLMRQRTEAGYFEEGRELHRVMLEGEMPPEIRPDLERMLDHFGQYPILIRSSSLLEDGFGNAFAGKYESIFCVNQGSPEHRLAELEDAIRRVYASTLAEDALVYRRQRGIDRLEEPMALLMQRVNGRYHRHLYLPDAAGVGVSRNPFVWDAALDPKAGMLRLVMGLGTRAVDRIGTDHACVVALDQPHRRPFRDREDLYRFSQHEVDCLDVNANTLASLPLRELVIQADDLPLERLGELDRAATRRARELGDGTPVWRLTFTPLLRSATFVERAGAMLQTLEAAYQHPVDVEFTVHLDETGTASFNLVQCRPLPTRGEGSLAPLPESVPEERLFIRSEGHFMGGNLDLHPGHILRVDSSRYAALSREAKHQVATLIGVLTRRLAEEDPGAPIVLIGPGRWGTSSPELGVPVGFADISRVAVLAEVAEMGSEVVPDLSFGSHFFQDLIESGIAYVALFPGRPGSTYRPQWLDGGPAQPAGTPRGQGAPDDVSAAVEHFRVPPGRLRLAADLVEQRLCAYEP